MEKSVIDFICTFIILSWKKGEEQKIYFIEDGKIKYTFPVCINKDYIYIYQYVLAYDDKKGKDYLFNNEFCFYPNLGTEVSVVKLDAPYSIIRLYAENGSSIEVYTLYVDAKTKR
jgi:hypothetical protein